MRPLRVRFTPEAGALLRKFHPENKKQIKAAVKELIQHPDAGGDLQEELSGFKSYRSKRYRIIYKLNEEETAIDIYYIGHRRDVYEQFRHLLTKLT
jgi:mRNA interferase RelE/StbE